MNFDIIKSNFINILILSRILIYKYLKFRIIYKYPDLVIQYIYM